MARVKYTPVKYPGGKHPPKSKAEVLIAEAKVESKRHKDCIAELLKTIPRISVPK
jgi:hypothetical protein